MSATALPKIRPQRPEISRLARVVRREVGDFPVIVLGSRALGTARAGSDLDAYVVLPAWRLPHALAHLESVRSGLERELGIPVSLNPLPAARLGRDRGAMLPFKLREEGLVACAPQGWQLAPGGLPPTDTAARRSYAMSGLLFLLEAADPLVRGSVRLDPPSARLVRKALLHGSQLALAQQGRWVSTLPEAVSELGAEWVKLAEEPGAPAAWLAARAALLPAAAAHLEGRGESVARGLQWAALRTLRGSPTVPMMRAPSPAAALAQATCRLTAALEPGGVDGDGVALARALLPRPLRRGVPDGWAPLARLLAREWPNASPLAGI